MSLRRLSAALAVAGLLFGGVAAGTLAQDVVPDPAIATMTVEQIVEARQDAMRENGGILRGIARLGGAEGIAAADTLIQNFVDMLALYPEGSIVGDSKALPVIWQEKEAFDALFNEGRVQAEAIRAAFESGDASAIGPASQAIGQLCGQCHQKYRS